MALQECKTVVQLVVPCVLYAWGNVYTHAPVVRWPSDWRFGAGDHCTFPVWKDPRLIAKVPSLARTLILQWALSLVLCDVGKEVNRFWRCVACEACILCLFSADACCLGVDADIAPEIWLHIFRFLDIVTLARCKGVCRAWAELANVESLWKGQNHREK